MTLRRRTTNSGSRPAVVVGGAWALLVALVLAGTACGRATAPSPSPSVSASPPRQTSGIRGIVLLAGGPYILSPSPLPAGFGSGHQGRPDPGVAVQVSIGRGTHKGRVIATLRPDANALFTIAVPPGAYVLKPLVPKGVSAAPSTAVVVPPGRFVRALVYAAIRP